MKQSTLITLLLVACQGSIGGLDDNEVPTESPGPYVAPPVAPCDGICTGESPLSHLSAAELEAVVRTALPENSGELDFSGIPEVIDVRPSYEQTNALRLFAERAAETLATTYHVGCEGAAECERQQVEDLIGAFYRRPASNDEVDAYVTLFNSDADPVVRKRLLFSVLLQSPHFRYRIEIGEPAEDGARRLTSDELAVRLSLLVLGVPPDSELRAADLTNPDALEAQTRRLLTDPRSDDLFVRHYVDLLGARAADKTPDGDATFGEVGALMDRETELFIQHVLGDDGTYSSLLTAPYTFANARLAEHYGLETSGLSEDFEMVELDEHRAGILSQGAVLVGGNVNGWESAATHRGIAIFHNIVCEKLDPPADFMPEPVDFDQPRRDRVAQRTACGASCHARFDPMGFAFGQFDHQGVRHDEEHLDMVLDDGTRLQRTFDIDTAVELRSGPVQGRFDGPIEFANLLAESEAVHLCHSRKWMEDVLDRHLSDREESTLAAVHGAHDQGHLHDLLVEIVRSDSFRYRIVPPAADWSVAQ